MPQALNVIALISGGKDSFFSLLHCLYQNHHVVALANLYPAAASDTSDLNSYMYQTVGHTIVPLYADALGLPLYRRQISGSAVNSQKDYYPIDYTSNGQNAASATPNDEDETESLLHVLEEVKAAHPTANAISSGAILSTYQRTRIESVALRLGLTPLAYLWQYPSLPTPVLRPGGLLEDMAAVGLDARVVKVASGGLDEGVLWCSIKDERLRRKIERDVARFGGSVLGEGGEYETLVVSGPSPVWKKGLDIDERARQTIQAEGGEYWIAFEEGSLTDLTVSQNREEWRRKLKVPELWDKVFAQLVNSQDVVASIADVREEESLQKSSRWTAKESITRTRNLLTISNIIASSTGLGVKEQMNSINRSLDLILQKYNISVEQTVFTTLLLRSMQDFTAVNSVYATPFTKPNPPARVTVACGDTLPPGVEIMASFVIDLGPRDARHGLHVQSRSYWAPANIGPYSQAISVPVSDVEDGCAKKVYLVYLAGQIPLMPASMEVLGKPETEGQGQVNTELLAFWEQTCLSLQHLWRVGKTTGVTWWANGIVFIAGKDHVRAKAMLASRAWEKMHERSLWEEENTDEDDSLDIWDQEYGGQGTYASDTQDDHLPDFERLTSGINSYQGSPGFFAVQVDELPRGCSVEWQGLGIVQEEKITLTRSCNETTVHICSEADSERYISTICIPATGSDDIPLSHPAWAEYVASPGNEGSHFTIYTPRPQILGETKAQVIPCRSVWGKDGVELAAGVVQHVDTANEALSI